ncbi:uncharacterized protein LOC101239124 [Hydra vulgaris]|uniref:uncharacterized protein LOC101239124 n=1 Tax=Hydra vulgaris TaxID=6087 RepID=UPI0002B4221D|nr:protein PLASTID MOVEMENT IMPAIRED 2 [Hydra vulgaris]
MSTSARLDAGLASGVKGIKEHMKTMQANIKELNEKSDSLEKQELELKKTIQMNYQKKMSLRDQISEKEETLRKCLEKLKEFSKRMEEKLVFLEESKKFHNSLVSVTPDVGMVAELEKRLKIYKDIYGVNLTKYQKARDHKSSLEEKLEIIEGKVHEKKKRVEKLQTELEYNRIEEERRAKGCVEAIDSAFKSEKTCVDLEKNLEAMMLRKEEANRKVNVLEQKVTKAETNIETLNCDRRKMETTLKEYLLIIKDKKI